MHFDPLEIRSRSAFITSSIHELDIRGGYGFYSRGVSIHLVWPGVASNSRLQLHSASGTASSEKERERVGGGGKNA